MTGAYLYETISIGEMISIQRLRRGLNQTELAKLAGVSRNYISMIERGKDNMSYSVLKKIFESLGLEINISVKSHPHEA